ncbi:looped-hinge helix DNA binding domain-containing protein, AbrB family [Saccharopolyspora kobensis]|uniref:Looped-hinge helix DNA binding domain-containing protein, AbrB family n=1 Tax=Saccharopolyspora kobensis TaxID=146035 RepID=A0A1H6ARP1_9PSEU|nr:AbrB/MazE/SpoVT family DNA-binding domain-containing protein [Saccharopolyspora kobensis]SEG51358.1 looped-hinge helix DNA binding domain-containing protein, AbrB family [Saccharopolyspora kobensis]SFE77594.1 transcriptional regulator, AbrB family [Saccharopolyspora kobensis]
MNVKDLPPEPGKFAGTVKVGEKGQIVIPKGARDLFGINPGDTLLLLADVEQGIAIVRQDLFDSFIAQAMPSRPGAERAADEK